MTLPDVICEALNALGKKYEMSGSEFLKQYTLAAGMGEVGALKLYEKVAEIIAEKAAAEKAARDLQAALEPKPAGEQPERELFGDVDNVVLSLPGAATKEKQVEREAVAS